MVGNQSNHLAGLLFHDINVDALGALGTISKGFRQIKDIMGDMDGGT